MAITSDPLVINDTYQDVVAALSLASGKSYSIQNRGGNPINFAFREAAIAANATIAGYHVMGVGGPAGTILAEIESNTVLYMWCSGNVQSAVVATEAP